MLDERKGFRIQAAKMVCDLADEQHQGTVLRLQQRKQGNEDYTNWLTRMVEPRVLIEVLDFVSAVIAKSKLGRIAPADPDQGKRNARYVPYWAAENFDD